MPRRGSGLRVERRPDTGALTIVGTVAGERIRQRAQSDSLRLATEEAAALEAELLRTQWHGPRRGVRRFAEAVKLYVETAERSQSTLDRLRRLVDAMGELKLGDIRQETINRVAQRVLQPGAAPATVERGVIVPVRAVMRLAFEEGWCDPPRFRAPKRTEGRTLYLLPEAARALIAAADPGRALRRGAPSLQVLIRFILGTGARMAEAVELDWQDVDLAGARAIFWRTKTGKRRNAHLPADVVAMLANLPHKEGRVIRRPDGEAYWDREREMGGQVRTAWSATRRRAILAGAAVPPELTPHDLRHTWASWHYALFKDPLRLKVEGGWSSLEQIERYCHLLPQGFEHDIEAFWHGVVGEFARAANE
jgi:integrase